MGILFEAHKELGSYSREKQYGDFIEKKLKEANLKYERELAVGNTGNIIDFTIDDKIILELKCARGFTKEHYRQIQNYLQQTKFKLGVLANFISQKLESKRILRVDPLPNSHDLNHS